MKDVTNVRCNLVTNVHTKGKELETEFVRQGIIKDGDFLYVVGLFNDYYSYDVGVFLRYEEALNFFEAIKKRWPRSERSERTFSVEIYRAEMGVDEEKGELYPVDHDYVNGYYPSTDQDEWLLGFQDEGLKRQWKEALRKENER